jgi:hypothetical protein
MDTIYKLFVGIGDVMAFQDVLSQSAQDTCFDRTKSQSVDQQDSSFPDDLVLHDEML